MLKEFKFVIGSVYKLLKICFKISSFIIIVFITWGHGIGSFCYCNFILLKKTLLSHPMADCKNNLIINNFS